MADEHEEYEPVDFFDLLERDPRAARQFLDIDAQLMADPWFRVISWWSACRETLQRTIRWTGHPPKTR